MAYCPQCGTQYDQTASFCPGCGRSLAGPGAAGPARSSDWQGGSTEVVTPRIRARIPRFVKDALSPSEPVLAAFNASLFDHHKQGAALTHDKFVLTPQRIIMFHTGLFHRGMGEMPYRLITGVNYEQGFIHGKVVVEAANAGLTLNGIGNADAAFAEKIIAGGMAGTTFTATGPAVEPPLVTPMTWVILGLVVILIVVAVVLLSSVSLPSDQGLLRHLIVAFIQFIRHPRL